MSKNNGGWSKRARDYQEQVTGRSADEVYEVNGVEFDGFRDGVLLEAKGPGYETFLDVSKNNWVRWMNDPQGLARQMRSQSKAAGNMTVEWHVAEKNVADYLIEVATDAKYSNVRVIWTPPTAP